MNIIVWGRVGAAFDYTVNVLGFDANNETMYAAGPFSLNGPNPVEVLAKFQRNY